MRGDGRAFWKGREPPGSPLEGSLHRSRGAEGVGRGRYWGEGLSVRGWEEVWAQRLELREGQAGSGSEGPGGGKTACSSVWLVQRAQLSSHIAGQGGRRLPSTPGVRAAAPVYQKGPMAKPQPRLPSSPGGSQDALSLGGLSGGPAAELPASHAFGPRGSRFCPESLHFSGHSVSPATCQPSSA